MDQREIEKLVFVSYATVFVGPVARFRKLAPIKKIVSKHQPSTYANLRKLGAEQVINTLHSLLKRRVFESQSVARSEFPELFSVSLARAQQRSSSQAQVTRSEIELLDEIASQEDVDEEDTSNALTTRPEENKIECDDETVKSLANENNPVTLSGSNGSSTSTISSLYPSYLPYQAQHEIFCIIQQLLEQACYDFTKQWLPGIADRKSWHCAEAIELHKWTRVAAAHLDRWPEHYLDKETAKSVEKTLIGVNKIRHTAVHRLHTSMEGLLDLLRSALAFSVVIGDNMRSDALRNFLSELESKAQALAMNKNYLECKMEEDLQEIARRREELLVREQTILTTAQEEDALYSRRIGSLLVDAARRMATDTSSLVLEDASGSSDECFDDAQATQTYED